MIAWIDRRDAYLNLWKCDWRAHNTLSPLHSLTLSCPPRATTHASRHALTQPQHTMCFVWVSTWTAVIRVHGPKPVACKGRVWVSNHTSMIDFLVHARRCVIDFASPKAGQIRPKSSKSLFWSHLGAKMAPKKSEESPQTPKPPLMF